MYRKAASPARIIVEMLEPLVSCCSIEAIVVGETSAARSTAVSTVAEVDAGAAVEVAATAGVSWREFPPLSERRSGNLVGNPSLVR